MNQQNIIRDIKKSFDFLCAMQPDQLYAKSYNALGEFFFAVNDADRLSNEQKAGIAEFGREYGLGKAKYAPETPQMPAHYVFQGNVADLKPAEAMAKMRNNQQALKQLRESKPVVGEGSDPAYKSVRLTEGLETPLKRVGENNKGKRIDFRSKQGPVNSDLEASNFESAVNKHRRKKIGDESIALDPTIRRPPVMRR